MVPTPPGENDDGVGDPHERLQTFLDVRHDHQFIDDGVGRFGGDDAGLGNPQIAAITAALLGVGHMGALHRAFHGARAATGADVQMAQPQLIPHALAVVVLFPGDRMAAPAHHQIGGFASVQYSGVAQNMKYRVADAVGAVQIETATGVYLVGHINDVTQYRREMFPDTADHAAVDEGAGRRVVQLEHQTAVFLHHLDIEIRVGFQHLAAVVGGGAGVEHRQSAAAQQIMQPP